MDNQTELLVGLVCSDEELVEYYVQLITEIKRFTLKAIWCPDTERSIDIAANNDVPSVSHTAFQLISRNDINTVVITGHAAHSALFCMQAQALKKKAICIGAAALSEQTAQLLAEFSEKNNTFLQIIYPLKYSTPVELIKANIAEIGSIQSISVEATFEQPHDAKHRLYNECNTVLHQLDPRMLVLEGCEDQGVLWRGDGTMESIIRTGTLKALENCDCNKLSTDVNELSLVQCVSICRFI
ncbi:hypothetical protein QQG55_18880 [Brugia pahangi]